MTTIEEPNATRGTMQFLFEAAQRRANGLRAAAEAETELAAAVREKIPEFLALQSSGSWKPHHDAWRMTLIELRGALENGNAKTVDYLTGRLALFAEQERNGQ